MSDPLGVMRHSLVVGNNTRIKTIDPADATNGFLRIIVAAAAADEKHHNNNMIRFSAFFLAGIERDMQADQCAKGYLYPR